MPDPASGWLTKCRDQETKTPHNAAFMFGASRTDYRIDRSTLLAVITHE